MITIKDIADKLGVSPSTVTRALADNPRIGKETRRRIQHAALKMGYVANAAAKSVRGKQSTLIGLLIPDIENSFYARIAKAFSDVCNQHRFQLALAVSDDDPEIEERHIRELVEARCAGVAIVPSPGLSIQSARWLSSTNTAQLIRRSERLTTDWYGINDIDALKHATGCLLDLGHRRIGLICGEDSLNSGRDRHRGYLAALEARSMRPDPELIRRGPPRAAFARQAAHALLQLDPPVTALLAAGAGLSEGMLNAMAQKFDGNEYSVSLIGYSDSLSLIHI